MYEFIAIGFAGRASYYLKTSWNKCRQNWNWTATRRRRAGPSPPWYFRRNLEPRFDSEKKTYILVLFLVLLYSTVNIRIFHSWMAGRLPANALRQASRAEVPICLFLNQFGRFLATIPRPSPSASNDIGLGHCNGPDYSKNVWLGYEVQTIWHAELFLKAAFFVKRCFFVRWIWGFGKTG